MNRLCLWIFTAVMLLGLMGFTSTAQAVPLNKAFVAEPFLDTPLPGTTVAARPELAGTVLEDVLQPFSFGALNISGVVQNRVVREDVAGTLDFYWRVLVDPTSTGGGVSVFRLFNFDYDNLNDADWRIDGEGSAVAYIGKLFNPADHPDGRINFLFDPDVPPGDPAIVTTGSYFFFLHTDATQYTDTAMYVLQGGTLGGTDTTLSPVFQTFAPVPEPTTIAVSSLGLCLLLSRRPLRRF